MFKKSILAATLIALSVPVVATAAFAGEGSNQLAAQAGVNPGLYTDAQLISLLNARTKNDTATVKYILSQAGVIVSRDDTSAYASTSPSAAQLAANLGVAPGAYSLDQMIQLSNAIRNNDSQSIAFILSGSNNGNVSADRGVASPAKTQLAESLRVDAASYTTAELAAMYLSLPANNSSS